MFISDSEANGARVFPWELELTNNNSASACLGQCAAFGYTAGGMEFGELHSFPLFVDYQLTSYVDTQASNAVSSFIS
jgi:hypothetical protein